MSQASSEIPGVSYTWLSFIRDVSQACDLVDLYRRCEVALTAIIGPCRFELIWDIDRSPRRLLESTYGDVPSPTTQERLSLTAGHIIAPINDAPGYVPLRVGGKLYGWLWIESAAWDADQTHNLETFAAILAPTLIALDRNAQDAITSQRQHMSAAAQSLRGILDLHTLLEQLCTHTRTLFDAPNFLVALSDEESDWLELAYLFEKDEQHNLHPFWRRDAGLTGAIMRTRAPVCTDNYDHACQQRSIPPLQLEGTLAPYAWLGVPLLAYDQVIGALVIFQVEPGVTYTGEDVALLQDFANDVALPIQNARLYARAERQARQLATLNRIGHSITSTLDPELVPSLIMQQTGELLDIEEGSLLLLDKQCGDLIFSYASGPAGHQLLGQRLPAGVGIAGYVANSGESAVVNDTRGDGRFYSGKDDETGFVTRSLLAVPLRGIDGIQGVIEVMNKRNGAPFIEEDRRLLEAVADQAVIALENAKRFAQVDQALARRVRELNRSNKQLHEILRTGNALRAEQNLDVLLHQIAEAAGQSTGFRSVVIALVYRERTTQPYLQRVVASGPATDAIERLRSKRAPLEHLETLLRPEFRRGSATYLIDHQHDDYLQLWGDLDQHYIPDLPPPSPGGWHALDTLFSLLRNKRGEILGLLRVEEPEDGMQPTPEQIQILEIFANQAAVAIENARLYGEQQHSLHSMIALNALGMAINKTLRPVEQILALTISGLKETTVAQNAVVLFTEEVSTTPPTLSQHAVPDEQRVPLKQVLSLASYTIDQRKLFDLAQRALRDERLVVHRLDTQPDASGEPSEAWVAVPLHTTQHTLGVICIQYGNELPSAADLETLSLFASQAAVAIQNVRLFTAVHQGHDKLASIMASTREGIMLIMDDGQVAVMNSAFRHLSGFTEHYPITELHLETFLTAWEQRSYYVPEEWQALRRGVSHVTNGKVELIRGEFNQPSPAARALEWTVLRVTRDLQSDITQGRLSAEASVSIDDVSRQHVPATSPMLLLVLRDITSAKETERLRQDLTSMIVHDLRSPLTSILTSIDMIVKGTVVGESTPRQRDVLKIAFANAERLLSMVNLMLDISRLEGGHMPLERLPLSVDQLVQRATTQLELILRDNNLRIERYVPGDLNLVYADGDLILRVLQNLLDNAVKFSNRNNVIEVRARESAMLSGTDSIEPRVDAGSERRYKLLPDRWITLSIRDYGPGIAPSEQEKIFAKFGQAGRRRRQGSGLGLTFCKLVIEAHGGRIWVESTEGAGSTFLFTLPVARLALPQQ